MAEALPFARGRRLLVKLVGARGVREREHTPCGVAFE